jgi:hypothetical protein
VVSGLFYDIWLWVLCPNVCFAGILQAIFFLFPSLSSRSLSHLVQVTKIGASSTLVLVPLHPLEVTREASLVLDLSITKTRGISIEVTVIGVPSCVTHLLFGLGFSLTTNRVINKGDTIREGSRNYSLSPLNDNFVNS